MIAFLRLIRIQNLLIIILLQYFIRYLVIGPVLNEFEFEFQLSTIDFNLMVLATVLLTAGGYVINDYFDRPTDLINRPDTVVVGKTISRRSAIVLHIVLNIIGVGSGVYASYHSGIYQLGVIYLIVAGLLWYYSTTYKRQLLIGNIIVSVLTALVPLLVVVYEVPLLNKNYADMLLEGSSFNYLFYYVLVVSYFAFFTTLIREIIKDIEDLEGDNAFDRNTLPVVLGVKYTKLLVYFLIAFTIASLISVYFIYLDYLVYIPPIYTLWYLIICIAIPLVLLMVLLIRADSLKAYHLASQFSKVIMLLGILYLVYREIIFRFVA